MAIIDDTASRLVIRWLRTREDMLEHGARWLPGYISYSNVC